ncbi:MAG: hypothetical protein IT480_18685, partial [Gammaproteobacteria bacterium]|nr:hypothetical protein [Gammaproteobacteria bacterium]
AIWQHTDKGSVPGIAGNVDMNRFDGTRAELMALGKVPSPGVGAGPSASNDEDEIHGLRTAVAYLADKVIPMAVAAAEQREYVLAEAQRVREQYVGVKP